VINTEVNMLVPRNWNIQKINVTQNMHQSQPMRSVRLAAIENAMYEAASDERIPSIGCRQINQLFLLELNDHE
jgi:hypothetical protein